MIRVETLQEVLNLVAAATPAADRETLQESTDLYDLGLDSTTAVILMLEIEEKFGITFPDSMITEETFRTPGALSFVVESLLQP